MTLIDNVKARFRTRVPGAQPSAASVPQPVPGPAPAPKDTNAVSPGARVAQLLKSGTHPDSLTPQQLQAFARYVTGLSPDQQKRLSVTLMTSGIQLNALRDVHEVSLVADSNQETVNLATGDTRITVNDRAKVYHNGKVTETITPRGDGRLQVVHNGETQLWDGDTGKGTTVDGKPLEPRPADRVPGEAPRKPWPATPVNHLVEPSNQDAPDFAKQYDNAVRATGGHVEEPLNLDLADALRYNCHSFATTHAQGDLRDPFDNDYQPRWVNFPTYQLTNGPFKKLAADQRVHVGDVILYADDKGVPTHTGVVKAVDGDGNPSQIESKWGAYGLYTHGPMDVPPIYGHIEGFYRPDAATPTKNTRAAA